MRTFGYKRARNAEDALREIGAARGAAFVAGGTTLIDLVKLDVLRPRTLIDINRIGLERIEERGDGGLRIGALSRNSDLARHPAVRARYPVLSEALLSGASAQLRNLATTAGNLMQRTRCPYYRDGVSPCNKREAGSGCAAWDGYNRSHAVLGGSPACIATHPSDMCVALAVLDARVEVEAPHGRRWIDFEEFHREPGTTPEREFALEPGELVTAVEVPPLPEGSRSWYVKLRDRESFEFALASAAVVVRVADGRFAEARVALGGVGTRPWRAREAEEVLTGAPVDDAVLQRAAHAALAGATARPHNGFKIELARRVIVRALALAIREQPEPRLV